MHHNHFCTFGYPIIQPPPITTILTFPLSHLVPCLAASVLQAEHTPLDAVHQDVSALEVRVDAPASKELVDRGFVILGIDIKEADLLNLRTVRVLADAGDIDDAETGGVVGLVGETIDDVLAVGNV